MCNSRQAARSLSADEHKLDIGAEQSALKAHLEKLHVQSWIAKHMARRMTLFFGLKSKALISGFLRHGWSATELYWLDQYDTAWRKKPAAVFRLEKSLLEIKLSPMAARRMIIESPLLRAVDEKKLIMVISTMQSLGFTDMQLLNLSRSYPKYFRLSPEEFADVYNKAQCEGSGALWRPKAQQRCVTGIEVNTTTPQVVANTITLPSPPWPTDDASSTEVNAVPLAKIVLKRVPAFTPPPNIPFERVSVPFERHPAPAPYEPEEHLHNWQRLAQEIIRAALPNEHEAIWTDFIRNNSWITSDGIEARALEHLYTWVPFGHMPNDNDPRALFFASILLNRNFPEEKRGVSKSRQPHDLSSILKQNAETVYFRMYTCRRILGRDPIDWPEGLSFPWEQIEPCSYSRPQGFSIPPPPMTDEATWIAKRDEIRFRANHIRDQGSNPARKPFLRIMQEPSRDNFMRRLERHLKTIQ